MAIEKDRINSLLERGGIRPSPARILTLRALIEAQRPLSALEIEETLGTVDRSSITRTLTAFADAHLVHLISDGSGSMKYEICDQCGKHGPHADRHAHFHCRICGQTTCLTDLGISLPELPDGYMVENATFVIGGLCPRCAVKNRTDS